MKKSSHYDFLFAKLLKSYFYWLDLWVLNNSVLKLWNYILLKLRVTAADRGPSSCTGTAVLTVNVNRNLNGPVWQNTLFGKYLL